MVSTTRQLLVFFGITFAYTCVALVLGGFILFPALQIPIQPALCTI